MDRGAYTHGRYEAERRFNPFVRSLSEGRVLSALQLPFFMLLPPGGFGDLTTTGRRTGKTRRKCIRAIRRQKQGLHRLDRGRAKIQELRRTWFRGGTPLVVELSE
jgi:hypothetical protein